MKVLLADAGEPEAATPATVAAADAHAPPAKPAAEAGVGSRAVFTGVPLTDHGTIVGKRRIVLHVLSQSARVGLELAAFVLGSELPGGGFVVKLEELQLDIFTLTARHRVHDQLIRVLLPSSGV